MFSRVDHRVGIATSFKEINRGCHYRGPGLSLGNRKNGIEFFYMSMGGRRRNKCMRFLELR